MKMPIIESVSICVTRVPLDQATSFATRTVRSRDYCLVKIRSVDGIEGIGFCYAGSTAGRIAGVAVAELLAPVLIRQSSTQVESLWKRMYNEALLHGRTGSVMRALSALDIALWDLNSRSAGLPLFEYLGANLSGTVPAYASGGYYLEGKTPDKLAEEASSFIEQGFRAVKIKVGRLDPGQEEERVRVVREAIGPDVDLMLDANNAWEDLPTALSYCERFQKYRPYWIEEPFSPDEIDLHRALASSVDSLIATGEIEAGRWRFRDLLLNGVAVLQADAAVCGGVTEWRRIAQIAASFGVTVSPHWFHDLHIHLVASVPNGRFVEFFPDDQVLNFRRLINQQLHVENGRLSLPDRPGLGFDFLEESLIKYGLNADSTWQLVR
jgi:L-alanine-DL-glutamate epimerase-like enolase superfamily enzyme